MTDTIEPYFPLLLRIDTPYSIGTGFYWPKAGLVVCNEYIVRDNREVIVSGGGFTHQLVPVLFTDSLTDVAFLAIPKGIAPPDLHLHPAQHPEKGTKVIVLGRPGEKQPAVAEGELLNTEARLHDLDYLQHTAKLAPVHSGGLLFTSEGDWLGMTYLNEGLADLNTLALPTSKLIEVWEEYQNVAGVIATRCTHCGVISGENNRPSGKCPKCSSKIVLPNSIPPYEAIGVSHTIERMLERIGRNVHLARRGPNQWEIEQGSARIIICYHEDSGLINGDAYLCRLPKTENHQLYEYILRENYRQSELSLSIKNEHILLSLLIYDRYLNVETGLELFRRLFERADQLDNELVEQFGARWEVSSGDL